jgi:hypothetical protein
MITIFDEAYNGHILEAGAGNPPELMARRPADGSVPPQSNAKKIFVCGSASSLCANGRTRAMTQAPYPSFCEHQIGDPKRRSKIIVTRITV